MATLNAFNVAGPGVAAGAVLASISNALPGHQYEVACIYYYTGTPGAADADNLALVVDGVQVAQMPQSPNAAGASLEPQPIKYVVQTTTGLIQIKTIALPVATTVIHTSLIAEDIGAEQVGL